MFQYEFNILVSFWIGQNVSFQNLGSTYLYLKRYISYEPKCISHFFRIRPQYSYTYVYRYLCMYIFPKCLWTPCSSSVHIRRLMGKCTKLGTPLLTSDFTFFLRNFWQKRRTPSFQALHSLIIFKFTLLRGASIVHTIYYTIYMQSRNKMIQKCRDGNNCRTFV